MLNLSKPEISMTPARAVRGRTTDWTVRLITIPGNGNCLFASLCHQIFGYDISSNAHREAVASLRREVVAFLWANKGLTKVRHAVITRISDEWPYLRDANYSDKLAKVLGYLQGDGHWGGEETLISVMELYNVSVTVYYQNSMVQTFVPASGLPLKDLKIYYKLKLGSLYDYNHYDSVSSADRIIVPPAMNLLAVVEVVQPHKAEPMAVKEAKPNESPLPIGQKVGVLDVDKPGLENQPVVALGLSGSDVEKPRLGFLRIGSYNVQGCNELCKRDLIDSTLHARGIHIACLQEARVAGSAFSTSNYVWSLSSDEPKGTRGTAILLANLFEFTDVKLYKVTGNIFHCSFLWKDREVNVVNVFMPPDSESDFVDLGAYILKMRLSSVLITGDFNARVGKFRRTKSDRILIGDKLLHDESDGNGKSLTDFMRVTGYKLKSSFLKSNSLLFTKRCGEERWQIDHILLSPLTSTSWTKVPTDHKLVICDVNFLTKSLCLTPDKKVNGKEGQDETREGMLRETRDAIDLQQPRLGSLRTCSYNVRGCNDSDKRNQIDAALSSIGIHIACLQETKLTGSPFRTDHYAWTLCYDKEATKTSRGTAILISKHVKVSDVKFHKVSGNIFHCSVTWMNQTVNVVNVYMPSTSTSDYFDLRAYILKANLNNVLMLGDFNARLHHLAMRQEAIPN